MGRFFLVAVLTVLSSCHKTPAFWSDKSFVSKSSREAWIPSNRQIKKTNKVKISEEEYLPEIEESLSIVDAFDIALMNSPDTQIAYAESKIAAQNLAMTQSTLFPKIDVVGNYTKDRTGSIAFGQVFTELGTYYGASVNVSYLIFQFGNRIAAIEESLQALSVSNWQFNQTMQDVLVNVSNTYFTYLYEKAYLTAVKEDLMDAEIYLLAAEEKFNAGVIDCTQLQEAKTQYYQEEVKYHNQRKAVKISLLEFKKKLGVAKDLNYKFPSLEEGKTRLLEFSINPDNLIKEGKKHRPSYLAVKSDVLAKEASVRKAETEALPSFNVSGLVQPQGTNLDATIHNYQLNFTVSFPLFQGFYFQNNIKKSKADLERSKKVLTREEVNLTNDILEYSEDFTVAQKQVNYTYKYLESSRIEKESAWKSFQAGTEDFLHVSSSLASYADAKAQYLNSLKKLYTSYFDLLYGMGTLTSSCEEKNNE